MGTWARKVTLLLAWWLWMPAVYTIVWLVLHQVVGGRTWPQSYDQRFMANFWSRSGLFWAWFAIGFIGTAVILMYTIERDKYNRWITRYRLENRLLFNAALVLALLSAFQLFRVVWDNDKDFARYYNQATVFYVPDAHNAPQSVQRLTNGAHQADGQRCDLTGGADVPSCIKQGTLDLTGWEPRVGSLDGARIALSRTSGDVQKVSLNTDTMAYLNEWRGQSPRWSGVLDGSGINQALGGISEWEGQGQPIQCLFTGDYAIDRAFGGDRSKSLPNLLADKFPALRWDITDVWGYCDDQQPIVVIPMTRQVYFKDRTVDTAGGLVIVQGDHGKTKLTYHASAKPDEFPGPVYPASLVVTQREEAAWAAGRENENRNGFGYEPAKSDAQAGNVSEYLLRNKTTGHLEWVTPLTLRHSSSELFVAYSVTPADQVSDRSLNQLSIYVLADNDPRRINIDNLEADARNYLANNAGTFISNGGKLVEFTPVDGDVWRAFGELNGRVVYRLDISASRKITPQLVSLEPQGQSPQPQEDNATCGKPFNQLTPNELTTCIKRFADELSNRQQPAPSSSG